MEELLSGAAAVGLYVRTVQEALAVKVRKA